ncbi:MAG: VanZ family protein [Acidaminococcaceae bacterium]|nr:VanZ family protein [Acidaminococcaceae bacterium]MDD4721133.1 VanZ family protein [Acidaminococcaceae bacterium]
MKKYVWLSLAVVGVIFIWGNSLQTAESSECFSELFACLAENILQFFNVHEYLFVLDHIVRKLAHFTEFALQGIFVYKALRAFKIHNSFKLAFIMGVFTAAVDETIQLFVSGRASQISDVILDSCGALVGVLVIYWWEKNR